MTKDNIIYLISGIAIGAVAGCLLTRKKCMAEADAEIDSMREHYLGVSEPINDEVIVATNVKNPPKPDLMAYYHQSNRYKSEDEQSESEKKAAESIKDDIEEYEGLVEEGFSEELETEDEEQAKNEDYEAQIDDIGTVEEYENEFDTEPYAISSDEFVDYGRNDKVTATYFAGDHVLMSEDEEVLDLEVIGGNLFLDDFDDDDTLYIRNNGRGIDYEVIRSENSYADAIQEAWTDED